MHSHTMNTLMNRAADATVMPKRIYDMLPIDFHFFGQE